MGFFDGYENVADTVSNAEAIGFSNPKVGSYYFEVTGAELQKGNKNDAEALALIIKFALTDSDDKVTTYNEYNNVPNPADPRNPTEREKQQAGFLKARLVSLGIEPDRIATFEADDIIGAEGSLRVVLAKNPAYITLRDVKVKGSTPKAAAPVQAVKPVAKRAPAKAPAQRVAQPVASAPAIEQDETVAAPEAPKAKPQQVVGNPFAR